MKNALYIACDTCAEVLDGLKGTAKVTKDYLQLRGSLSLQKWNEAEHRYNFFYAAQRNDMNFMHFCDGTCLEAFLNARKDLVEQGRKLYEPVEDESSDDYWTVKQDR